VACVRSCNSVDVGGIGLRLVIVSFDFAVRALYIKPGRGPYV
jgi:hypothetical protein